MFSTVRYPHSFHGFFYSIATFCSRDLHIQKGKFNVFKNGKLVNQVEALENKSDVSFSHVGASPLTEPGNFMPVEIKLSTGGIIQ